MPAPGAQGHSAVKELARQLLAIEAMTDYRRGITTTVGTIVGGTAPNVVPRALSDVGRPPGAGRGRRARIGGADFQLAPYDPDVKLLISGGMNRPAYRKSPQGEALYQQARALAQGLGLSLGRQR